MTHEERARAVVADYAGSPHPLEYIIALALKQVEAETARVCADIAGQHERGTLEAAKHKVWGECEHHECSEQRSMSKTARMIGAEIRAAFPGGPA